VTLPEGAPKSATREGVEAIVEFENARRAEFSAMDQDGFLSRGVAIFQSSIEGIPTVNPELTTALEGILRAILNGEAPEPAFGYSMAPRTYIAWQVYMQEFIGRIQEIDVDEIPFSAQLEIQD
jgi:hypothetical protein